jgi:hypothetical protein
MELSHGEVNGKWTRNCPTCGRAIFHSRKDHRNHFQKINAKCKSCSKIAANNPQYGKPLTDVCRKKISNRLKGKLPKNIGIILWRNHHKIITDESREKMRLSRIAYLKRTNAYYYPNYNQNACEYFRNLNHERGWNGRYALNGGEYEVGGGKYFLDYYEPVARLVIEYDEPHHYTSSGNLRKLDVDRMNEIRSILGCDFYRYREETKELKKYE